MTDGVAECQPDGAEEVRGFYFPIQVLGAPPSCPQTSGQRAVIPAGAGATGAPGDEPTAGSGNGVRCPGLRG